MTLRITRADGSQLGPTLRLEGRIEGAWAALLERESAALLRASSAVSLDLTAVVFVDRAGVEVLKRLSRAGVEICGSVGPVASVLEAAGIRVSTDAGAAGV